jgi:hypothetical protein
VLTTNEEVVSQKAMGRASVNAQSKSRDRKLALKNRDRKLAVAWF